MKKKCKILLVDSLFFSVKQLALKKSVNFMIRETEVKFVNTHTNPLHAKPDMSKKKCIG